MFLVGIRLSRVRLVSEKSRERRKRNVEVETLPPLPKLVRQLIHLTTYSLSAVYSLIFIKCSKNSVLGETRFNVGLGGLYTYSIYSGFIIHCIRPEDITIQ